MILVHFTYSLTHFSEFLSKYILHYFVLCLFLFYSSFYFIFLPTQTHTLAQLGNMDFKIVLFRWYKFVRLESFFFWYGFCNRISTRSSTRPFAQREMQWIVFKVCIANDTFHSPKFLDFDFKYVTYSLYPSLCVRFMRTQLHNANFLRFKIDGAMTETHKLATTLNPPLPFSHYPLPLWLSVPLSSSLSFNLTFVLLMIAQIDETDFNG